MTTPPKRASAEAPRAFSCERGVTLILTIGAILLITVLGLALTSSGILSVSLTTNKKDGTQAFYFADTGITHAKAIFFARESTDFDEYLQAGNGTACDGDELSDDALFTGALTPAGKITSAADGGHAFGSGRYEVSVCDDHLYETATNDPPDLPDVDPNVDMNDFIRVVSTGYGTNGATATVEVIMRIASLPALLVEGNLMISGNPKILGDGGAVHTNGDLEISGNPCAEQYFSSNGTLVESGSPETGSGCAGGGGYDVPADERPGSPTILIPDYNPSDYSSYADYTLKNNGEVRDSNDVLLNNPADKKWCPDDCWDFDDSALKWTAAGDDLPEGTYYTEGSFVISANLGHSIPNFEMTLIAEGWIDIAGNPEIVPDLTLGDTSYSMIAGTDLKVSGNPTNPYNGLFYAGHQVNFSGNPTLTGQAIAMDRDDTAFPVGQINLVERVGGVFMVISGNVTIIHDEAGAIKQLNPDGWRECRGLDPANPCN